jgi:hypothetical protein
MTVSIPVAVPVPVVVAIAILLKPPIVPAIIVIAIPVLPESRNRYRRRKRQGSYRQKSMCLHWFPPTARWKLLAPRYPSLY